MAGKTHGHHDDLVHDEMQELFDKDSEDFKLHSDDMLANFTEREKGEIQALLELVYHAGGHNRLTHTEKQAKALINLGKYMAYNFLDTLDAVAQANVEATYSSAREAEEARADHAYELMKERKMFGDDA